MGAGQISRAFFQPRRGYVPKPRVGAYPRLPWVEVERRSGTPKGLCPGARIELAYLIRPIAHVPTDTTPLGLYGLPYIFTQGRRGYAPTLGFVTQRLRC